MAIRANDLKIAEIIIVPVSILMVYVQNLAFSISAPLAFLSTLFKQANLQNPKLIRFITRAANFILDASSIFIRTSSATCYFVGTGRYRSFANNAGLLFSI